MKKIFKVSANFEKVKIEKRSNVSKNKKNKFLLAKFINIGYYLIIPILVGIFLGISLDEIFHTQPFFLIVFLFFGVVSCFYNLARLIEEVKNI